MEQQRFRVNQPQVIRESFESEVVIINLDNGNYYSLEKTGALIWDWLERGVSPRSIAAYVSIHSRIPAQDMAAAIERFIADLQAEQLIVPAGDDSREPPLPDGTELFEPPVLHRYDDMQELLLLDPIHEVDANGWPNRAPTAQ